MDTPTLLNPATLGVQLKGGCTSCPFADGEEEPKPQMKSEVGPSADPAERQADEIGGRIGAELANAAPVTTGTITPEVQSVAEKHLGVDLSETQLRSDATAATRTTGAGALAMTEGSMVSFGAGMLSTSSPMGRSLLGHELTHVAQQTTHSRTIQASTANGASPFSGWNGGEGGGGDEGAQRNCALQGPGDPALRVTGLFPEHAALASLPVPDYQVTGFRYQYERAIFFDHDSAEIQDPDERAKILRWARRPDAIKLVGNASPEGDRNYNKALTNRRIAAVTRLLNTLQGSGSGGARVVRTENIFDTPRGCGGVDFRKVRRVEILRQLQSLGKEDRFEQSTLEPGLASACDTALAAIPRAHDRLSGTTQSLAAIKASPESQQSLETRVVVQRHFHTGGTDYFDPYIVEVLLTNIGVIDAQLLSLPGRVRCLESDTDANCPMDVANQTRDVGGSAIICPRFSKLSDVHQDMTLIHEAARVSGVGHDYAFIGERTYDLLTPAAAIRNADSYAAIAADLTSGLASTSGETDRVTGCIDTTGVRAQVAAAQRLIDGARETLDQAYAMMRKGYTEESFHGTLGAVRRYCGVPSTLEGLAKVYSQYDDMRTPFAGSLELECQPNCDGPKASWGIEANQVLFCEQASQSRECPEPLFDWQDIGLYQSGKEVFLARAEATNPECGPCQLFNLAAWFQEWQLEDTRGYEAPGDGAMDPEKFHIPKHHDVNEIGECVHPWQRCQTAVAIDLGQASVADSIVAVDNVLAGRADQRTMDSLRAALCSERGIDPDDCRAGSAAQGTVPGRPFDPSYVGAFRRGFADIQAAFYSVADYRCAGRENVECVGEDPTQVVGRTPKKGAKAYSVPGRVTLCPLFWELTCPVEALVLRHEMAHQAGKAHGWEHAGQDPILSTETYDEFAWAIAGRRRGRCGSCGAKPDAGSVPGQFMTDDDWDTHCRRVWPEDFDNCRRRGRYCLSTSNTDVEYKDCMTKR